MSQSCTIRSSMPINQLQAKILFYIQCPVHSIYSKISTSINLILHTSHESRNVHVELTTFSFSSDSPRLLCTSKFVITHFIHYYTMILRICIISRLRAVKLCSSIVVIYTSFCWVTESPRLLCRRLLDFGGSPRTICMTRVTSFVVFHVVLTIVCCCLCLQL